jgi:sugar lactone lactonase YvrE
MRRVLLTLAFVMLAVPATAAAQIPETIRLPDGWRPEGIAAGPGPLLFVGSLGTGAIWAADARTGRGAVRVPPHDGRVAVGIKFDGRNRIFVAGGATGQAYVYDARTGEDIAAYQLTSGTTFVNDVVLTRRAAYFTDSRNAQLYVLPLGRRGELPEQGEVRTLPLTGDFVLVPGATNLNGIEATDRGRTLISVSLVSRELFTIDPGSGRTRRIDLGGATLTNGDGLLLLGRRHLFVVRNRSNLIAEVRLNERLTRGRVVREITDPDFDVPTTLALKADLLYTVNARFTTTPEPTTRYDIVRVG